VPPSSTIGTSVAGNRSKSFTSLDPQATAAIEALIREAAAAGVKVVLVTHDRDQARRMADEIVFLHRGRVAEQAPAGRFFDHPRSAEAHAYLAGRLLI
jgi:tungstate transport system ATP-binding protein